MRLEYFSYLLEIYRHRSISTAAHALKMKQSTLSSIVKSVETELGFPIFLRAPTGVAATAEGERFLNLAWEINVRYEELKSLSRQEEDGTQPIRVLMSPSINAGLALPLSRQFYEFDLRGDLTIEEHPSTDIGPLIARNEANIGVAHLTQPMVEAFRCQSGHTVWAEVLYQDHSCLVVPPGHRLAARKSAQDSDLSGERLAMLSGYRNLQNRTILDSLERSAERVIAFPNLTAMEDAILQQNMVGLSTMYAMWSCGGRAGGCCAVPLQADDSTASVSVCLLYRIGRSPRYQERILMSCIRSYFQEFPPVPGRGDDAGRK